MRFRLLFLFGLFPVLSWGNATTSTTTVNLSDIQANGLAAMQTAGGNSFSGQVAWTPTLTLGEGLYLRGVFGASLLKKGLGGNFVLLNYEVLGGRSIWGKLGFEVGGGLQTWVSNSGTHLVASANLTYGVSWFDFFDRIFFGYSRVFMKNATNFVRLGAGIVF